MHPVCSLDRWVFKPRPNPEATMRLFCFPYAGGGAQIFRPWPRILPTTIEVCSIELPGRGMRIQESIFTRLSPLAEAIVLALEKHLDKPFAFFGHSMGALLSFEIARCLRRQYLPRPIHLFISGRGAPHVPNDEPLVHTLPEPEFLNELHRLNGTPKEVLEHEELMQLMLPILRADFAVCGTYSYVPEPPLDCPITVFGGLLDERITADCLEAWGEQTHAACSVHMFPGDHFFLHNMQLPLLQLLSRRLQDRIA